MKIKIASRLCPFSHTFGARCLIPGTDIIAKIYPSLIELEGIGKVELPIKGPIKEFTSQLDLEKGDLTVFGRAESGHFQYKVKPDFESDIISIANENFPIKKYYHPKQPIEKVSFGCHKAQDWEAMRQRCDLGEWLPLWHRMAQWLYDITPITNLPGDKNSLGNMLHQIFEGSFSDYFVPCPERWKLLGLNPPKSTECPLALGPRILRSALITFQDSALNVLPCLPRELICGRYLNASFPWGSVDFEWTKGLLRRLIIHARQDISLKIILQKEIVSFRLQEKNVKNGEMIELKHGNSYYFDRFEK